MTDQIEETKKQILRTLKPHGVKKASLFGSIVRGELTDKSDIDILVEFSERKSLLDLVSDIKRAIRCIKHQSGYVD